ncbi:hypothetical protein [Rubrivirga sp.]|uniref:hypothetical protein n=1 Tax=Rubrivirga sp. TaxID=1885344 RepID=UPI003C706EAC
MRSILLAALALVAAPSFAQDVTLRPGHSDLTTTGLTFESHVEAVRIAQPAVQDLGLITHQVTRDGNTITMNVDANVPQAGNVGETSITFDATTMAPMSRQRTTSGASGSTTYDGDRVTGAYGRGDWAPLAFDITLDGAVFTPEQVPLVARAIPQRSGYQATVPTFSADRRVRDVAVSVEGQEEFTRTDGSTVTVWAVEAVTPGRGGGTLRYLIADGTRELIATSFSPQEGTVVVTEPTTEEALAALEAARTPGVDLRPGADGLMVDALEDYTETYTVKVVAPMQQDIGTATRTLTVDREAGTATLETTLEIAMAGQNQTETTVVAYPSLRPISSTSDNNGETVELTYSETDVTGMRGEEAIDQSFDEPVFDSSWLQEVVRLLPFEEGYRASFKSVTTREGETAFGLEVVGQDEIDGMTVWHVRAQPTEGPPVSFFVTPERELARMEMQPQVGVTIQFVPAEM